MQSFLIAGSLPAILFPFAGLATAFLQLTAADDYANCLQSRFIQTGYIYEDHLRNVMRSYSCWYFGYSISKPQES